jgi:hypothetical protein
MSCWTTLLVFALGAATDPVRLGIAVLLISRPRPMPNLLAYWLGASSVGMIEALGLLILQQDVAPMFVQTLSTAAASSTARHIRIAIGVLALPIAALIAVGISAQPAQVAMAGGDRSAVALRPSTPTTFGRLVRRGQNLLEDGPLWVPFVAGILSGPAPIEYLVALTAIAASGAAIGTQFSAAVAFIVLMLAVVEVPLVTYLATPTRTQAVMVQLHDWMRPRRRRIVAVMVAVSGIVLVATGV